MLQELQANLTRMAAAIESTSTPSPKEPELAKAALRVLIADDEEVVREAAPRVLWRHMRCLYVRSASF